MPVNVLIMNIKVSFDDRYNTQDLLYYLLFPKVQLVFHSFNRKLIFMYVLPTGCGKLAGLFLRKVYNLM